MGLRVAVTLLPDLYGSGQTAVGGLGSQEFRLEGCQEWRPCCMVYICVSVFVHVCPCGWITWEETSKDSKIGSEYPCQGAKGAVREQGRCPIPKQSQQQLHWDLGQENIARMSAGNFLLAPHLSTWRPEAHGLPPHPLHLLMGRGAPLWWWVWEACLFVSRECVLVYSQPHLGILSCREPAVSSTSCARWVSLISGWSVVD